MSKRFSAVKIFATSSFLFLSLLLFSFSCEDHPEPPRIFPVINTLDVARADEVANNYKYSVQFSKLGNQEILEYGIVTYAGTANQNVSPTVPVMDVVRGRKYAFKGPGYLPANLDVKSVIKQYDGPGGAIRLFYRAYALLANNNVVYGQVKYVDFSAAGQGIHATIETESLMFNNQGNINFLSLEFTDLGNMPITEYGVCYVGALTANPVVTPKIINTKHIFTKPVAQGIISEAVNLQTGQQPFIFYRAYVKFGNGDVRYGEVKTAAK